MSCKIHQKPTAFTLQRDVIAYFPCHAPFYLYASPMLKVQ